MTRRLSPFQLRTYAARARAAGLTLTAWLDRCDREHERQRAVADVYSRSRDDLRATIARRCVDRGNTYSIGDGR